ncbi:MAG: hypothetical protein ACPHRO_09725 [Nannocystaceae bacterium]
MAARLGQILFLTLPIALSVVGCADAPVYSVSLQVDGQNAAPSEMTFAVSSPRAGKASPIAARLGEPGEDGLPQQYFALGEPIVLRIASTVSQVDALESEVVWSSGDARYVTAPALDEGDQHVVAVLPEPHAATGRWTVEVSHPRLGDAGPLLRNFEVLRVSQ